MEQQEYAQMGQLEEDFWWYRALHNAVVDRLRADNDEKNQTILDAGCGTGGLLAVIQRHHPEWTLHGLEKNPWACELASNKSSATIASGDIHHLPYPDNFFDQIVMIDVLYHQAIQPLPALMEAYRCLKPGGQLHTSVAAFNWMYSGHDQRVHTRERYSRRTFTQLLQQTPLLIDHVAYWNSLLFPVMVIQRFTTGQLKSKNSEIRPLPAFINNTLYGILDCERKLFSRLSLPFGGSVWARATKPVEPA